MQQLDGLVHDFWRKEEAGYNLGFKRVGGPQPLSVFFSRDHRLKKSAEDDLEHELVSVDVNEVGVLGRHVVNVDQARLHLSSLT
jgi:hypothetical protein